MIKYLVVNLPQKSFPFPHSDYILSCSCSRIYTRKPQRILAVWGVLFQNDFLFSYYFVIVSVSTVNEKSLKRRRRNLLGVDPRTHTDKFKALYQEVLHKVLRRYSECQENCEILIILYIFYEKAFFFSKMTVHEKYILWVVKYHKFCKVSQNMFVQYKPIPHLHIWVGQFNNNYHSSLNCMLFFGKGFL